MFSLLPIGLTTLDELQLLVFSCGVVYRLKRSNLRTSEVSQGFPKSHLSKSTPSKSDGTEGRYMDGKVG